MLILSLLTIQCQQQQADDTSSDPGKLTSNYKFPEYIKVDYKASFNYIQKDGSTKGYSFYGDIVVQKNNFIMNAFSDTGGELFTITLKDNKISHEVHLGLLKGSIDFYRMGIDIWRIIYPKNNVDLWNFAEKNKIYASTLESKYENYFMTSKHFYLTNKEQYIDITYKDYKVKDRSLIPTDVLLNNVWAKYQVQLYVTEVESNYKLDKPL